MKIQYLFTLYLYYNWLVVLTLLFQRFEVTFYDNDFTVIVQTCYLVLCYGSYTGAETVSQSMFRRVGLEKTKATFVVLPKIILIVFNIHVLLFITFTHGVDHVFELPYN